MIGRRKKNSDPEQNNSVQDDELEEKAVTRRTYSNKKARVICIVLLIIVVLAAAFFLYSGLSGNHGMRKAQKLAKKIGEPSAKASEYANAELKDSSDYSFLNELVPFDKVCESEKKTSVYGVGVPQWTIWCSEDSFGKLESVTYSDFRVLNHNINGIKKQSRIDVSGIVSGKTYSEVNDILDMKPYQTVYSESAVSRKYKYYYNDKEEGAVKAYYITVIFSKDNNSVNSPVIEEENHFIREILKAENQ